MKSERKVTEHPRPVGSVLSRGVTGLTIAAPTLQETPVAPAIGSLYIQLLGRFAVTVGDCCLSDGDWYLCEAMTLVKLLALAPNGRLHHRQIIGYVWPYAPDVVARHRLDRAIHVARLALDSAEPHESPSYLSVSDDSVVLGDASTATIDVDEFIRIAQQARKAHDPELYDEAIAAYPGDLLPDDIHHEWTVGPRRHLMSVYADLVEARRTSMKMTIPWPSGGWLRERPYIA